MFRGVSLSSPNERNEGFYRAPEIDFRIDFRNETEPRKVMVDFKFDALLYR